jgi:hypothetical protein
MMKYLVAFLETPSAATARKLIAYDQKHRMASCMLTPSEITVLQRAYAFEGI